MKKLFLVVMVCVLSMGPITAHETPKMRKSYIQTIKWMLSYECNMADAWLYTYKRIEDRRLRVKLLSMLRKHRNLFDYHINLIDTSPGLKKDLIWEYNLLKTIREKIITEIGREDV